MILLNQENVYHFHLKSQEKKQLLEDALSKKKEKRCDYAYQPVSFSILKQTDIQNDSIHTLEAILISWCQIFSHERNPHQTVNFFKRATCSQ